MKKILVAFTCLCFCIFGVYLFIQKASPKSTVNLLVAPNLSLPQDAFAVTPKELPLEKSILSLEQQNTFHKIFLRKYYYPWSRDDKMTEFCLTADGNHCNTILDIEKKIIADFSTNPGYNNDYQPNSKTWMSATIANMQLNSFPNMNCHTSPCHGITVTNANIRALPTLNPSYGKITKPGEGYPFDYIQESNIWLGTPVMVIQQSKDHHWLLIKAAGLLGWVQAKNIAFVSESFMKKWQSYPMVTPILLKFTINPGLKLNSPNTLYLGSLLPYTKSSTDNFITLFPVRDTNQQAEVRRYKLSNSIVAKWPLNPTPKDFNLLINQLLGMPYGWGGIGFNTDCSGTMQRLFGAFGIWLPRNAKNQLDFGGYIYPLPVSTYTINERKALFSENQTSELPTLKPYLTLIGFGDEKNDIGHVALYLGQYAEKGYTHTVIFQSVWGNAIMRGNVPIGRAIIGKAAITTMNFGVNLSVSSTSYGIYTLWEKPCIYVTDITKPLNTVWLKQFT